MSETAIRKALINGMMAIDQPYYIKMPNSDRFIKRDGIHTMATPENQPWLRLTLLSAGDTPITIGQGGYNRRGCLAQIDVFTPKSQASGELVAAELVDEVRKIFKTGAAFNGIRINSASTSNGTDEGSWYSRIINVDFNIDIMR